jgi:hypothetical protein
MSALWAVGASAGARSLAKAPETKLFACKFIFSQPVNQRSYKKVAEIYQVHGIAAAKGSGDDPDHVAQMSYNQDCSLFCPCLRGTKIVTGIQYSRSKVENKIGITQY